MLGLQGAGSAVLGLQGAGSAVFGLQGAGSAVLGLQGAGSAVLGLQGTGSTVFPNTVRIVGCWKRSAGSAVLGVQYWECSVRIAGCWVCSVRGAGCWERWVLGVQCYIAGCWDAVLGVQGAGSAESWVLGVQYWGCRERNFTSNTQDDPTLPTLPPTHPHTHQLRTAGIKTVCEKCFLHRTLLRALLKEGIKNHQSGSKNI